MYSVLIISFLAVALLALCVRPVFGGVAALLVTMASVNAGGFMYGTLTGYEQEALAASSAADQERAKTMTAIDSVGRQAPKRKPISVGPEILAKADADAISAALSEAYASSPVDEGNKGEIRALVQAFAHTESLWKQKYAEAQASYAGLVQREYILRKLAKKGLIMLTIPDWVVPTFVCDNNKWDCANLRIRPVVPVAPKS